MQMINMDRAQSVVFIEAEMTRWLCDHSKLGNQAVSCWTRWEVSYLIRLGIVVGVAGLANLFWNYRGAKPKQELLLHLSEARTAKFAVKQVKYNGHDRTPSRCQLGSPIDGAHCGMSCLN